MSPGNPTPARGMLNEQEFGEQLLLKNRALAATAEGVTITDPSLPDNPLIYANEGFERLTGYSADEVIGRNCRFLQGPDTDPETVELIREALRTDTACTVQILNYRKDGTPFWNRLSITPVRDAAGKVTHQIGIQSDVTAQKEAEDTLRRIGFELEAANQRMKSDLEAAAKVQRSLLPVSLPKTPGVEFAWSFQPSDELAGDLLNIFTLPDGQIGLYILDVSGHGVASALLSVTISRLLTPYPGRSVLFAPSGGDPSDHRLATPSAVARKLNEYFPFDPRTAQYFTLLYGILDPETREFDYVSAGHQPPIHLRASGALKALESTGPPVGMLPNAAFEQSSLKLGPGDRVYLCTDGVIEAESAEREEFGDERLFKCLTATRKLPVQESLDVAMSHVSKWCGAAGLHDDASMLAFEIKRD
jgi:sigma-B regulation protein RsbU (phosphoserine phosphatase)